MTAPDRLVRWKTRDAAPKRPPPRTLSMTEAGEAIIADIIGDGGLPGRE
jgi:hypothetical protein